MKNIKTMAAIAMLTTCINSPAIAENQNNSKVIHTGSTAKNYDSKIEAAAIRIVAKKMGDLRGLIGGFDSKLISSEKDLLIDRSSSLGFSTINEPTGLNPYPKKGTVPLV